MNTVAFFNNKGGVENTTLVYHLAHMLADLEYRVLLLDLDPQSNLTAYCLSEEQLEDLWTKRDKGNTTVLGCVNPILRGLGDILPPSLFNLTSKLALVPGDLALSRFEDTLSDAWPRSRDRDEAAFRILSAFYRLAVHGAQAHNADIIFFDVGPNLGAINRAALLASEHVLTPLAPDLFSMQGLKNLGPTLLEWRRSWKERLDRSPSSKLNLPKGRMNALGYIMMQSGMRLDRPVKAYGRWVARMPVVYHEEIVRDGIVPKTKEADAYYLGVLRHYQSLMPLAQDAQKPMFFLKPADGAIGAHMKAVERCYSDFRSLALKIIARIREKEE